MSVMSDHNHKLSLFFFYQIWRGTEIVQYQRERERERVAEH
jgi:hypothetical protein